MAKLPTVSECIDGRYWIVTEQTRYHIASAIIMLMPDSKTDSSYPGGNDAYVWYGNVCFCVTFRLRGYPRYIYNYTLRVIDYGDDKWAGISARLGSISGHPSVFTHVGEYRKIYGVSAGILKYLKNRSNQSND